MGVRIEAIDSVLRKFIFWKKNLNFEKNAIISTKIAEPELFFHLCRVDNAVHVHVQL